jgi:hypothetical protein
MTICIGALVKDAVVLAADTQETYSGVFKLRQKKILAALNGPQGKLPTSSFAVTGAGTATQLDAISQHLCSTFSRDEHDGPATLRRLIEGQVLDFNHNHIAPYAGFPEYERPSCSLLMAASVGNTLALFTSDKSSVRETRYGAVGIGAAHASLLLGRLWTSDQPMWSMAALVAYAMWFVKQSVDGCGQDTQMVVLNRKGPAFIVEVPRVELLEHEFAKYSQTQDDTFRYVLGMGPRKPPRRPPFMELRRAITAIQKLAVPLSPVDQQRSSIQRWIHDEHPLKKKRVDSRGRRRGK